MTEEQKQALIEWLEEGLMCSAEYGFSGNSIKSMQIALTALTAPAADLAELVPPKMTWQDSNNMAEVAGWNACCDAILRNIEAAK